MNKERKIFVFADWVGLNGPILMGTLFCIGSRGKEIYQFEYDPEWIKSKAAQILDPGLMHFSGRQFPSENTGNFGLFFDSMPDRWGRQLMTRREAINAKLENRKQKPLTDSDFLLGVDDFQRSGGLRLKLSKDGSFLNNDPEFKTPPWTSLRDIEFASIKYESNKFAMDKEAMKWFKMLLAPGSSLGGARPKAGVKAPDGALWIAKFPSKNDEIDVGAWEKVIHELAKISGIRVPDAKAQRFSQKHHTFLSKRFDREITGERIHFASAMTMLQHKDGDDYISGVSYMEMIPAILKLCSNPNDDLEELWRRIVFFILVKNTDDHLRNHGFLLVKNAWQLSPAYDMNCNPYGTGLNQNIDEFNNDLDLDLALSVAGYFRVNKQRSKEIIRDIEKSITQLLRIAKGYGIPKNETDFIADSLAS